MRCILISFFNSDNIGDVIIANTLYEFMKNICNTEKISYSSEPFVYTDINKMYIRNKANIKNLVKIILYRIIIICNIEKIIDYYREYHKSENINKIEEKIVESDIVVIGGGNMIFDATKFSRSASGFKKIIDIAKNHNKKVFVISIGIGPFVTQIQEKQAVEVLNRCDFITFRDSKSLEIYRKYYNDKNFFLTIDPVFMLPCYVSNDNNKKEHIIGINLFDNRLAKVKQKKKYNEVKKGYVELINMLLKNTGLKIVLFSTALNDYKVIEDVYKKISTSNVEVRRISGFDDLIKLYNEIDLLIGCRMHSMIIAYTQYIPVIGLSWQPKVDAFFDIINQPKYVFRYDRIHDNLKQILDCCVLKLNNLKHEKEKIQSKLKEIRTNFKINEDIMSKLIK